VDSTPYLPGRACSVPSESNTSKRPKMIKIAKHLNKDWKGEKFKEKMKKQWNANTDNNTPYTQLRVASDLNFDSMIFKIVMWSWSSRSLYFGNFIFIFKITFLCDVWSSKLNSGTSTVKISKYRVRVLSKIKLFMFQFPNQTFYYTRRITPKRTTSLRCPSPRHSANKATQLLA